MRPKKLSIEGLNSFIERQTIDFDRLTAKGFFGIFGPTGSGKSSILDGITLALYGRIARGSAEFVNKQVDTLSLSYEFSLGQQHFKVEREIKRNKNGEIRTAYAKLTELTTAGEVVLEDKASSVSKRCEDIIGLSVDDFSRTVVLPQGKFSEFLKLPNGQRREMLERIFNLEAYGAALSTKVAKHLNQVKAELSVINGQLMGYEDLSEDSLKQLASEVEAVTTLLAHQSEVLKTTEEAYSEAKIVYERFNHLNQTEQLLKAHLKDEPQFMSNTAKLERHDAAVVVKPYWQAYESTVTLQLTEGQRLASLKQRYEDTQQLLKASERQFEQLTNRLETEVPSLRTRLDLLREGRKDIELLMKDKSLLDEHKQQLTLLEQEGQGFTQTHLKASGAYEAVEQKIKALEKALEAEQVPEQYKALLRKGLMAVEQHERLLKSQRELEGQKRQLNDRLGDNEIKRQEVEINILADQQQAAQLEAATVATREAYQLKQPIIAALMVAKEKLNLLVQQKSELMESLSQLPEPEAVESVASQQLAMSALLEESEQQTHWLAFFKQQYHDEATCPICGQASQALVKAKLEERLLQLEEQWRTITGENQLEDAGFERISQEAITALEGLTAKYSEEMLSSQQAILEAEEALGPLTNALNMKLQQRSGLVAESTMIRQQLDEVLLKSETLSQEISESEKSVKALKENLNPEHKALDLVGLKALNADIETNEQRLEAVAAEQKKLRGQLEQLGAQREADFLKMKEAEGVLQARRGAWEASYKHYQDQKEKLSQKLGPLMSVKSECERLEAELQAFERNYQSEKQNLQGLSAGHQDLQNQYIELLGRVKDLEQTALVQQRALSDQLSLGAFDDLETAKGALLTESLYQSLKADTRAYQRRLDELKGTYEALKAKLADAEFHLEAFNELAEAFESLKESQLQSQQQLAQLQLQYQQAQQRMTALGDLLFKRDQVASKQAQLQDLAKLFEARKFVAFIASTQMAYISGKASEQLLEMTQGSYGIEAQADGSFLIRDYKNGGVTRDVSTLSGGETFLVSLALALALSAQVQLKGKAPLELFFLDEGFGTLDDETLEVVMAALENLSHERLSIGLISHVEAIKNRVPIKLMVTPAKAGMGGSRVKIELS